MRKMNRLIDGMGLVAGLMGALVTQAADWPQYLGPNQDDKTSEKIASTWPAGGPRVVWKAPTTDGFSILAVSGGKAFTLMSRDVEGAEREVCVAFDANTGKEVWAVPLGIAKYDGGGDTPARDHATGGDGPRSTPTIDGGRVYALDGHLVLSCLDAAAGKTLWQKDLVKELGAKVVQWQNAASPVLDGDLIYLCCGAPDQSLLGLNKMDGSVAWKGESDPMTHASPVVATILGVRQVIFFTQKGLVSAEAKTGKVLWRYPFRYSVSTAASPVVSGDIVYCSAGYGVGSGAARSPRTAMTLRPPSCGGSAATSWPTIGAPRSSRTVTSTASSASRNLASAR